jgi:hypothetical protein
MGCGKEKKEAGRRKSELLKRKDELKDEWIRQQH